MELVNAFLKRWCWSHRLYGPHPHSRRRALQSHAEDTFAASQTSMRGDNRIILLSMARSIQHTDRLCFSKERLYLPSPCLWGTFSCIITLTYPPVVGYSTTLHWSVFMEITRMTSISIYSIIQMLVRTTKTQNTCGDQSSKCCSAVRLFRPLRQVKDLVDDTWLCLRLHCWAPGHRD